MQGEHSLAARTGSGNSHPSESEEFWTWADTMRVGATGHTECWKRDYEGSARWVAGWAGGKVNLLGWGLLKGQACEQ